MSVPGKQARAPDFGLIVLLGILLGIPYALTKVSQTTIPPLTGVTARVLLAAIALWVVAFTSRTNFSPLKEYAPLLLVQGIISCAVPYTLIAYGQLTVNSALTAILNSTAPVFVCFVSIFWTRHEPLNFSRLLGVAAGLSGVVMIAGVNALHGLGKEMLGQVAIIVATVCSAIAAIQGRRLNGMSPTLAAAGTLSCGAIALVPFSLVVDAPFHTSPSVGSITALFVNAFFGTALRSVIYFRLLRTIGSMGTSSAGYLKPAVGVIIGCTLLDESLTWAVVLGLLTVSVGVVAINKRQSFLILERSLCDGTLPAMPKA